MASDVAVAVARDVIRSRSCEGIEQVTLPFTWLAQTPGLTDFELTGSLALQALPRPPHPPGFRELFASGAFGGALAFAEDVRTFLFSNSSLVLASTGRATLSLTEDSAGLNYWARIADVPYGRTLSTHLSQTAPCARVLFRAVEDSWDTDAAGLMLRTIHGLELFSVDPCVSP